MSEQKVVNDWWRTHGDPMFKPDWNKIKLSKGNTVEHNMRVATVCIELLHMGIPFATEARLKCGTRPDIICPTHVQPIIEVLWSETKDDFLSKKADKYPHGLQGKWILHDAALEWERRLIL